MKLCLSFCLLCFFQLFLSPQGWLFRGTEGDRPDAVGSVSGARFQWTLLSDRIFPEWRDGIATIVRGKDLFIIGGWNPNAFDVPFTSTTNEVWRSTDGGKHWAFFAKAAFSPRHTFVCIDAADGYVYVIGGDQYNTESERSEVWRSKNLMAWELMSRQSPFGTRMLMAGVAYQGALFVGGGQEYPDFKRGKTDLFVSYDRGVSWQCLADSLQHLGKNIVGTMNVYNDRIYQVSGGWYGDQTLADFRYSRAVFSTNDGINWVEEAPIPLAGTQYPNTIVFDDKLWFIGGSSIVSATPADAYNKNDACYLGADGVWHVVETVSAGPKTHASSLVVYDQSMLMLGGNHCNAVYKLTKQK